MSQKTGSEKKKNDEIQTFFLGWGGLGVSLEKSTNILNEKQCQPKVFQFSSGKEKREK